MAEVTQLLIVPHTHWDREWYQTFQQFRMRLVRTIDRVLDVLESDPNFTDFMLDGQTIVLEDYLEVRPEQAERLQKLAQARRILVGPWYLQPDEFLVGGESLIRNLQLGMRIARTFGGSMSVGYVPDIFGHIAQLPQILRGFGLDNAVYWRGVGPEVECSEFRWVAPDGTSVLAIWLCDVGKDASEYTDGFRGYSNARSLPLEPDALLARIAQIEAPLRARATTNTLLLMNGSDHLEPQAGLPAALAAANKSLKSAGKVLAIGSLPQYVEAIKRANPLLTTYTGEMRSSRYAHLLPGVLSTRMWIKQRNAAGEAQLIRWAEPFSAWGWLLGVPYPVGLLRVSWRQLLYNHPHDSICGSGIDQVHEEMRPRFDQSQQIADELTQQALTHVAEQVDTREPAHGERAVPIVVFNPGPGPCTGAVACDVEIVSADVVLVDDSGQVVPHEIRRVWHKEIADQEIAKGIVVSMLGIADDGRVEGFAVLQVEFSAEPGGTIERVDVVVSEQGDTNMAALNTAIAHIRASEHRDQVTAFRFVVREVPRADLVFLATNVPAYGARTFFLRPRRPEEATIAHAPTLLAEATAIAHAPTLLAEATAIENEFYRVEVHPATGTLSVLDKVTGAHYAGLNLFQDGGDVGDLYNYSPPHDDVIVSNPRYRPQVEMVSAGPAQATLRISLRYELPARCAEDRRTRHYEMLECGIVSAVSLAPGVRRIDIRTEVENLARDHRLRVLFPAPFTTEVSEAEGAFEVVRRPVRQPRPLPGEVPWSAWPEAPVDTHPQKRFVDVSDGQVGLAVLNRGLPEYEVLPWPVSGGVAVALTLLRCVEWLSRADLETRHGHAGPMLHTPAAQEPGRHVFEYALVPHAGRWQDDDALPLAEAQAFEAPLRARVTGMHDGRLPPAWSFLAVTPRAITVSAIKRADGEDALVVRLYNPLERSVEAEVRLLFPFREAHLVNLDEEPLPASEAESHHLTPMADQGLRLALRGGEITTLLFRF